MLVVLAVALVAALVVSSLALARRILTPSRVLGRAMRPAAPTAPPAVGEFGEFVALYGACFGAESPGTELIISRGGWVQLSVLRSLEHRAWGPHYAGSQERMELRWSVGPDVGEAVLRAVLGRGLGLRPQEARDCQIAVWGANGRLSTDGYAGQVLRNEFAARLGHGFLTAYQTAVGEVEPGATCLRRVRSSVECVYARGGAWVYLRYAAAGRYGNAGCLVTGALTPGATVRAARDVTVAARFGVLPCEGCVEADDFDDAIRPHVAQRCP